MCLDLSTRASKGRLQRGLDGRLHVFEGNYSAARMKHGVVVEAAREETAPVSSGEVCDQLRKSR